MKKLILGLVITSFLPNVQAQLDALNSVQENSGGSGGTSNVVTINPSEQVSNDVVVSDDNAVCEDKIQNSIPLKFLVDGLMREKNSSLKITHNPSNGQIKIDGGSYIANCGDMLQWSARKPSVAGGDYLIELKIKRPSSCVGNECTYSVLKKDGSSESMKFSDTYAGFIQCLEKSGVLVKDQNQNYSVDKSAIVKRDMGTTLSGFDKTGRVRFVSYGPEAEKIGPKYSKVSKANCFYTEKIAADDMKVFSASEWTYHEKAQEVKQLCNTENYKDIFDNIGKYGEFENILKDIGEKLIAEDVKKMAKTIEAAKVAEDLENVDFAIIEDFQKHVIDPLTVDIAKKFEAWKAEPKGDKKEVLYKELKKMKEQLEAYSKSPYLTKAHLTKLKSLGQFSPARDLFLGLTQIEQHAQVGKIVGGSALAPETARAKVEKLMVEYEKQEEKDKRDYEILSCDRVGEADRLAAKSAYYQKRIQVRTKNYQQMINDLVEMMQTRCMRSFTPKAQTNCVNAISQQINGMKVQLQKRNKKDLENSQKLAAESERLAKLEAQAAKTCEKPEVEEIDVDETDDSVNPSDDFAFDFDFDDPANNQVQNPNQNMQNNQWQQPYQFNFNNQGSGYQSPFANGNSTLGLNFGMDMYGGMNQGGNYWNNNQGWNQFGGNQFGGQFGFGNQFGGNQFGGQFQQPGMWPAMNNMYQQPGMFNQGMGGMGQFPGAFNFNFDQPMTFR
jgi:hypothetical protein